MRTIATLCTLLVACAATPTNAPQPPARTTVLSLARLERVEAGERLAADLRNERGVIDARFDKRKAELVVTAAPLVDATSRARAHAREGYELLLGPGRGSYLPGPQMPAGADVATIASHGEDVPDIARHLVRGKVTVLDFSAYWCEPCRRVDEHIAALLARRGDIAYRKLEVVDWDSPIAEHYLQGLDALPIVAVYDRAGERVDVVSGLDLARLDAAIEQGAR